MLRLRGPSLDGPGRRFPSGVASGAVLVALLLPAGCGHRESEASATYSVIESSNGAGVTVEVAGITIEFGPGVSYKSHLVLQTGEEDVRETTGNGLAFAFEGDVIRLGHERFDGLVSGDRVRIDSDGISANGTRRWAFPGR